MIDERAATYVDKLLAPGLEVVTLTRPGCDKLFITAEAGRGQDPFALFGRVQDMLQQKQARIISQTVYGPRALHAEGVQALARACGPVQWPLTWLEGDGGGESLLTGTQVYATAAGTVTPVTLDGRAIGVVAEDEDARYCLLGDLRSERVTAPRAEQTRETFAQMEQALESVGMDFSRVVRTWLYVDSILAWYDELNAVRTEFFRRRKVFDGLVPASTGVGVRNPVGSALTAHLLAIEPKHEGVKIFAVPSPLQCPAPAYGSSFSRAVEVALPDHRRLYISGTASIEPGGRTVHLDDVPAQIDLSMRVAGAILTSRGMDWEDVVRGVGYFKDTASIPLFRRYCREQGLPPMPIACTHSDICRDDLLFEVELDAIRAGD